MRRKTKPNKKLINVIIEKAKQLNLDIESSYNFVGFGKTNYLYMFWITQKRSKLWAEILEE